jgi:thiamine biosynthesis protein ThiS
MKILLNNREEEFDAVSITIKEMIELKKFSFRMRIIKVNGQLIPKDKYESTYLSDGDNVLMLYLMSGG